MIRVVWALCWAVGLFALAWIITLLPAQWVTLVRLTNGFLIVAMLAWIIAGLVRYERFLHAHRTEIMALIDRGETNRSQAILNLMEQTEHIAADLAGATQRLASAVRKEQQTGQTEIVDKLEALESKLKGPEP